MRNMQNITNRRGTVLESTARRGTSRLSRRCAHGDAVCTSSYQRWYETESDRIEGVQHSWAFEYECPGCGKNWVEYS